MSAISDQYSSFYNAATLTERIAALRATSTNQVSSPSGVVKRSRRLQLWAEQVPFSGSKSFADRLAMDGTTESELEYLLHEPRETLKDRPQSLPPWLAQLADAFDRPYTPGSINWPDGSATHSVSGFLRVIEPLVGMEIERLRREIKAIGQSGIDLPFECDSAVEMFKPQLFRHLVIVLNRTLILELNVARLAGVLKGETSEERFKSFVERLGDLDNAFAILEEYPVLARQLVTRINNWVDCTLEFLTRLAGDSEAIKAVFGPDADLGPLVGVNAGAGDSHRSGRAVTIARFASGRRLVYKPRSLAVDAHFQDLLTWLNDRGDHPSFQTLKVLERGTHGWMEFVDPQECRSREEAWRFYERQGGYLALLYVIEAVDFHYENLIANGEHPVLIDLESLFHPRHAGMDLTQSVDLAQNLLEQSVMRTSLLPRRMWLGGDGNGIDLSGLGAAAGQTSPFNSIHWEKGGSDEMHVSRKPGKMPQGQNRPIMNGVEIDLLEYVDAIVEGFRKVYETIVRHREALQSDGGPLDRFESDEIRIILRPTRSYSELLTESFHPDMLRNALDRDRFFDRLWIETEVRSDLVRVIRSERDDLHAGDIPVFTGRPNSRDIWSSSGERIPDFFEETGKDLVRRRLRGLCEDDLRQQLWFVRASLTSLAMGMDEAHAGPLSTRKASRLVDNEELLRGARAVGTRLESLAIRGRDDATWIGLSLVNRKSWALVPLGLDLYSGMPGIALFLAYLGEVTGQERYTELAQSTLTSMRRQLDRTKSLLQGIGAFNGMGGIIYAFTHLGALLKSPSYFSDAEELIELIPPLIEHDEELDIIGGAAGCIACLLAFHSRTSSTRSLEVAIRCADHLIAKAVQMETGIGWRTIVGKNAPLTGFSHGAAGIAWALFRLARATSQERFRQAAQAAIVYERSMFSVEFGNWRDLREIETKGSQSSEGPRRYPATWCHGAPGIGLSRLQLFGEGDDQQMSAEVDVGVETTLAHGFGQNHSLCHGDLGNLELILQAAELLNNPILREKVRQVASGVWQGINDLGWLCGVPMRVETPGLMAGLAGIGYGLMRAAAPRRVPSVLMLEAPRDQIQEDS